MKCSFYSNPSYSPLKLKEEEEGWKKLRTFLKHLWCVKNWMKWKYHNRDSWEKDFNLKKNCLIVWNKLILFRSLSEASVEKSNAFVSFKLFFSNINHDKVFHKITRCDIRSSTIFQVSMFIIKMNYEMLFSFNCCLDFFSSPTHISV